MPPFSTGTPANGSKLRMFPSPGQLAIETMIDAAGLNGDDLALVKRMLLGAEVDPDVQLPPDVTARLTTMEQHAAQQEKLVDRECRDRADELLKVAVKAPTAAKRVMWLQRTADVLAKAYGPVSACRPGCSHCCHIPVKVSQAEATVIGKALSRIPVKPSMHLRGPDAGDWTPCSFLVDNMCSIHLWRPAVCRSHLNLDIDDLLCRPVIGASVPVPYLDTRPLVFAAVAINGNAPWADIRQWFPKSNG